MWGSLTPSKAPVQPAQCVGLSGQAHASKASISIQGTRPAISVQGAQR
jgi:hypothetical protein